MNTDSKYVIVTTTTANEQQAEDMAQKILARKLAACVQVQQIRSHYTWKGKLCNTQECLLMIKTRASLFGELEALIRQNHAYETPEILQVPVTDGSSAYLDWIDEVTNGG